MPLDAFASSLPFVLRWEGGFVDHPNDRGGATNKGVTQVVYDDWRRKQGLPTRSVREIQDTEVRAIYETGYWLPPRCNVLRQHLDLVQFDTAVNMGPGRAVRFLQEAVGTKVDGGFGPNTLKAVEASDLGQTLIAYCDEREAFYRRLAEKRPSQQVFLKGWLNRLNALRKEIGLPGFEAATTLDYGDADHIAKIPDVGVDPGYEI